MFDHAKGWNTQKGMVAICVKKDVSARSPCYAGPLESAEPDRSRYLLT